MIVMLIYKILTHSRQSCKSVYFILYFNVCTLKILPWINKFYLSMCFWLHYATLPTLIWDHVWGLFSCYAFLYLRTRTYTYLNHFISALTTNFHILVSRGRGWLGISQTIKFWKECIISSLCLIPPLYQRQKSGEISPDCESAAFHVLGSSWEICLSMRQISLRERVEIAWFTRDI